MVEQLDQQAHISSWVKLAQDGDWQGLEALYTYFFEPLYRFCYWQLGDTAAAQDATADTMMQMVKSIHRYQHQGQFRNWLYTIAKRQIAQQLRHKYQENSLDDLIEILPTNDVVISPEQDTYRRQQLSTLLKQLPDRDATILKYRYLDNLSVAEVAEKMQLTTNQVKVYTYRAKQKLTAYET